jgi:hypothetical protein
VAWDPEGADGFRATAVQIAESVEGRRRMVRHVGSARDGGLRKALGPGPPSGARLRRRGTP